MLALADARPKAAAVLAPVQPDDPAVLDLTDAVQPPCLVITWGEPWLTPNGQAPAFDARLEIRAIAGRYDVGAGLDTLEGLVAYAVSRFAANPDWAFRPLTVTAPRGLELGGILYLAAQIFVGVPVAVGDQPAEWRPRW